MNAIGCKINIKDLNPIYIYYNYLKLKANHGLYQKILIEEYTLIDK